MDKKKLFNENANVARVFISQSGDGKTIVKTKIVQSRNLEVGDKLSSRHGQKGIVGKIVPGKDMPFNDNGVSPDLIMNPHEFPSRMTDGKFLECLSGKASALDGERGDGTVFEGDKLEDMKTLWWNTDLVLEKMFLFVGTL